MQRRASIAYRGVRLREAYLVGFGSCLARCLYSHHQSESGKGFLVCLLQTPVSVTRASERAGVSLRWPLAPPERLAPLPLERTVS